MGGPKAIWQLTAILLTLVYDIVIIFWIFEIVPYELLEGRVRWGAYGASNTARQISLQKAAKGDECTRRSHISSRRSSADHPSCLLDRGRRALNRFRLGATSEGDAEIRNMVQIAAIKLEELRFSNVMAKMV
jgi:hypothetical protein